MSISIEKARKAKAALAQALAGDNALVGVGITKIGDDYGVKVNFSVEPNKKVPKTVEGVPVQVEIVGKIRRRDKN